MSDTTHRCKVDALGPGTQVQGIPTTSNDAFFFGATWLPRSALQDDHAGSRYRQSDPKILRQVAQAHDATAGVYTAPS